MRSRPANISLINRRHYLPRLLLTLSSKYNDKNNPNDSQILTGHTISISGLTTTHPEVAFEAAESVADSQLPSPIGRRSNQFLQADFLISLGSPSDSAMMHVLTGRSL